MPPWNVHPAVKIHIENGELLSVSLLTLGFKTLIGERPWNGERSSSHREWGASLSVAFDDGEGNRGVLIPSYKQHLSLYNVGKK